MAQGRHDQVAPPSAAERYAELLEAPSKQLVWFEHSAHMPHLEEPERFRELLAQVRLGLPPSMTQAPCRMAQAPMRSTGPDRGRHSPPPTHRATQFNRRRGVL